MNVDIDDVKGGNGGDVDMIIEDEDGDDEWPSVIMYVCAVFSVVRFIYLGDFVIHGDVAPN